MTPPITFICRWCGRRNGISVEYCPNCGHDNAKTRSSCSCPVCEHGRKQQRQASSQTEEIHDARETSISNE